MTDRTCTQCGHAKPLSDFHRMATGRDGRLLCQRCNLAIGMLGDNPDLIRAALRYVERHRQMQLFGLSGHGSYEARAALTHP